MANPSRVIFLTGAASGIGRHLAQDLAERGERLMLADLDRAALEELVTEKGWPEAQVLVEGLDVRDEDAWVAAVARTVDAFGRLDVMLNVAGYLKPGYIHELEADEIDRHFDINTKGVVRGTRVAAVQMVKQGEGQIVNIASLAAIAPVPGLNLYSASKFAVRGFSLAVAQELAPRGVTVTCICPDAVQTPMLDLQADYEEAALTFSGDRVLTTQDVVGAVLEAMSKRPIEVRLPSTRGSLAMLSNAFPAVARRLGPVLARKGRAKQRKHGA